MVGAAFLRAAGSIRFDVKTKHVLTQPYQLSTDAFISFSKFVKRLLLSSTQGTLPGQIA